MFSIISASSVGTMIEWYDFYIFGSLASIISTKFFPSTNPTAAFLSTLATFAAGFVVRPFGALVFGRLGDIVGRKYTFMFTLLLMGTSTFFIGCIPSYASIGFWAPVCILLLRLLQGLALGGEYGGAATYVAEHAPAHKRGLMTAWIQTTATLGLLCSLLVISATKKAMSSEEFNAWGWRVPFWVSIFMVALSYVIRKNMDESPLFAKAKAEGKTSTNPLKESFGNKLNLKFVLVALLGVVMGQGVVWYTGQFYAMSFIEKTMHVQVDQVREIMLYSLCLGTPFFLFFGWLSDKIGRKWIMLLGMLLAVLLYRPIYTSMYNKSQVEGYKVVSSTQSFQRLPQQNKDYDSVITVITTYENKTTSKQVTKFLCKHDVTHAVTNAIQKTDVMQEVSLNNTDKWFVIMLVWFQVILVTMVYGPVAAFLVELFPVKIRYTSMSLPYHIGNGIFGGLLPAVATYLVTSATKANQIAQAQGLPQVIIKPYLQGLWYPIIVAGICFVIGSLYIKEPNHNKL